MFRRSLERSDLTMRTLEALPKFGARGNCHPSDRITREFADFHPRCGEQYWPCDKVESG